MEWLPYIVVGVLGLIGGSFVNAWVWRTYLPASEYRGADEAKANTKPEEKQGEKATGNGGSHTSGAPDADGQTSASVLKGRSACPDCGHTLGIKDLVPVLSWLWLRGRCRYCRNPISVQYPVVEIITATAFLLSFWWWPSALETWPSWVHLGWWLAITSVVIAMGVYDLRWYILPDSMLWVLLVLAVVSRGLAAMTGAPLEEWLIGPLAGAAGAFLFFYGLYVVGRERWMGGGDVKLVFAGGLLVGGVSTIVALFIAFVSAAALGVGLMASRRKGKGDMLPFGPFLLAGFWLSFFFGDPIASWYTGLLLH
ncbi:prepilin peptidase [Candidatus Saccharibacteria bacterium QS_5_54_17]|nr:MAG: prepilin peptidase [Candidatus Saccharibacteria bacterium QS_5_54_17]